MPNPRIAEQASKGGLALRGRSQTAEHAAKRAASTMATLARTTRYCVRCQQPFTPTSAPQRYCSGACSEAVRKAKRYVQEAGHSGRRRRPAVTLAEYEQLAEAQGGVCAVCQETNGASRLCIDHDHATNQIRGLLCYRCNTALGLLRDDPVLLVAAASYLTDGRQRAGFPD